MIKPLLCLLLISSSTPSWAALGRRTFMKTFGLGWTSFLGRGVSLPEVQAPVPAVVDPALAALRPQQILQIYGAAISMAHKNGWGGEHYRGDLTLQWAELHPDRASDLMEPMQKFRQAYREKLQQAIAGTEVRLKYDYDNPPVDLGAELYKLVPTYIWKEESLGRLRTKIANMESAMARDYQNVSPVLVYHAVNLILQPALALEMAMDGSLESFAHALPLTDQFVEDYLHRLGDIAPQMTYEFAKRYYEMFPKDHQKTNLWEVARNQLLIEYTSAVVARGIADVGLKYQFTDMQWVEPYDRLIGPTLKTYPAREVLDRYAYALNKLEKAIQILHSMKLSRLRDLSLMQLQDWTHILQEERGDFPARWQRLAEVVRMPLKMNNVPLPFRLEPISIPAEFTVVNWQAMLSALARTSQSVAPLVVEASCEQLMLADQSARVEMEMPAEEAPVTVEPSQL